MTEIVPINTVDLLHVATNMRSEDAREIFATRWTDDPLDLVREILALGGMGWVSKEGGVATSAFGAIEAWPHIWSVWMFATDDFALSGVRVTHFIRQSMMKKLVDAGAHRAECNSIEGHDEAHRWLRVLGATHEATLKNRGKGGENFYVFSWV